LAPTLYPRSKYVVNDWGTYEQTTIRFATCSSLAIARADNTISCTIGDIIDNIIDKNTNKSINKNIGMQAETMRVTATVTVQLAALILAAIAVIEGQQIAQLPPTN
jgi:hypothetical protein